MLNGEEGGLWIVSGKGRFKNVGALGWGGVGWGKPGYQGLFFPPGLSSTTQKVQSGVERSMTRLKKKKNLGIALGCVASLGLSFSELHFPTSPPLRPSKAGGGSLAEAFHAAFISPPPLYMSLFWGGGCKAGTHGLLEIIKIYASVCKHTLLNHGVSPPRWYI